MPSLPKETKYGSPKKGSISGGRARGFRWYLGRSPPGAWSWLFRWHSSFGWVGSSQGRRSKFYCSKVAGEEVLAFWRQPIVPHPKDRGAAWVSKEVDSDLSCSGMWDGHNYCPDQILLADRPELQKGPFNSSQKCIPPPLLKETFADTVYLGVVRDGWMDPE